MKVSLENEHVVRAAPWTLGRSRLDGSLAGSATRVHHVRHGRPHPEHPDRLANGAGTALRQSKDAAYGSTNRRATSATLAAIVRYPAAVGWHPGAWA
jgi:hypothetical protein